MIFINILLNFNLLFRHLVIAIFYKICYMFWLLCLIILKPSIIVQLGRTKRAGMDWSSLLCILLWHSYIHCIWSSTHRICRRVTALKHIAIMCSPCSGISEVLERGFRRTRAKVCRRYALWSNWGAGVGRLYWAGCDRGRASEVKRARVYIVTQIVWAASSIWAAQLGGTAVEVGAKV